MDNLEKLRQEISKIDHEILSLFKKRVEVAAEIGEVKRASSLPIRDFSFERVVLERARRQCQALNLAEDLGEALIRLLVYGAVRTQEEQIIPSSRGKKIAIVGGKGRMGNWLALFCAAQGHDVKIYDLDSPGPEEYLTSEQDITILATPISVTPSLVERVASSMNKSASRRGDAPDHRPGVAMDICSIKSPLLAPIRKAREQGVSYVSIHPMFGPSVQLLAGRSVILCNCGDSEALQAARELFQDTALTIIEMGIEEHDEAIGFLLGLVHFLNLSLGHTLATADLKIPFDSLMKIGSTTFKKQLRTCLEVLRENPSLYYEIQHLNPHSHKIITHFLKGCEEMKDAALSPAPDLFVSMMTNASDLFREIDLGLDVAPG